MAKRSFYKAVNQYHIREDWWEGVGRNNFAACTNQVYAGVALQARIMPVA